jgi:hypothetical protein
MNKKAIMITALTGIIALSGTVSAYAADMGSNKDTTDKQIIIQEKLAKLDEKAQKLGLDINGLSLADAKAEIQTVIQTKQQEKAEKLGIDITGLSISEAKEKLQAAKAAKLGIDITGLSQDEIKAKIQEAAQAKKEAKAEKQSANEQQES